MNIKKEHEEHFIRWANINHGDHSGVEGLEHCEVAEKLTEYHKGKATFQEVYDAVVETDDGWEESWENYRKYNKL